MQVGVQGVFAQYYRDQIVENSRMGQVQAFEKGRWLNRAPTGYSMVNGFLQLNEKAPLVQRAFELRASGASYPVIAQEIGIEYSTVHHICANRAYLGETRLGNLWGPGVHAPLVSEEQFDAAQRTTRPGKRRSKDLLSGKVRCGLCLRVTCVTYNQRNQLIYRCKERGQGCSQPGRSANGLYRATMIAFKELREDTDLRLAIHSQLTDQRIEQPSQGHSPTSTITTLKSKHRKLLDLYYADQISGEDFATEQRLINSQISTLESQILADQQRTKCGDEASAKFQQLEDLLAELDFEALWEEATAGERRTLVEDLLDSICIYPDQITVQVAGAVPIVITLAEAGLRLGTRPVVSKAGLEPARP